MHWKRSLLWLSSTASLLLSNVVLVVNAQDDATRVRTDLVRLIEFDVQIALTGSPPSSAVSTTRSGSGKGDDSDEDTAGVDVFVLGDIVTDWMNDSFRNKSVTQGLMGNNTKFQTVALERRFDGDRRRILSRALRRNDVEVRMLQDPIGARLFTAHFSGVSLWERTGLNTPPINPELVELLQRATFLEDNKLLTTLQAADDFTGLGSRVVDVRAFITPPSLTTPGSGTGGSAASTSADNLEIIIIIAIVVACMAFGLLMFAVAWAWRTDRQKRDEYKSRASKSGGSRGGAGGSRGSGNYNRRGEGTGSESDSRNVHRQYNHSYYNREVSSPPSEIAPDDSGAYPDSVISEDISTSLTAYYKQGMSGYGYPGSSRRSGSSPSHGNPMTAPRHRDFNDGASMSSMDSYGYSLDGYAPSLSGGPTTYGYPVGPVAGGGGGAIATAEDEGPMDTTVEEQPEEAESVDDADKA